MNVNVEMSIGEFFDKITILEIKECNIKDAGKLANVKKELGYLNGLLSELPFSRDQVEKEVNDLREINEKIWDIEDNIRLKELSKSFDAEFIELARSVYFSNDKRAEIKRDINLKLESDFVEEKSYEEYTS